MVIRKLKTRCEIRSLKSEDVVPSRPCPPRKDIQLAMEDVARVLANAKTHMSRMYVTDLSATLKKRGRLENAIGWAIREHLTHRRIEIIVETRVVEAIVDQHGRVVNKDVESYKTEEYRIVRGKQELQDWWHAASSENGGPAADQDSGGETRKPDDKRIKPVVELRGPDERPSVFGEDVPKLRKPQYAVISGLVNAGPDGLHKDDLEGIKGDARKYLRELRDSSELWERAILMPGCYSRDGYRILHE